MVRSRGDGTHPVYARSESVGRVCSGLTVCNIVETREECENAQVGGLRGVKGLNLINDNVLICPLPLSERRTKVCVGSGTSRMPHVF